MQSAEEVQPIESNTPRQPRGGSRKGRPNRVSRVVKDEVLASLAMVGGRHYLARQAEENPTAYMNLLGKVIPQQVKTALEGITVVVQTLSAESAQPVRGVLCSPVAGNVWRDGLNAQAAELSFGDGEEGSTT